MQEMSAMKEEKCIILDYFSEGYPGERHPEPIAQAMGLHFTLVEIIPKEGMDLEPEEEVYIGEGERDKIKYIKGTLKIDDLTNVARSNLDRVIDKIVKKREQDFVDFFSKAGMITPRMHQFQLLPGIGKKHAVNILDARKEKKFQSFEDMKERVELFSHPIKTIRERVKKELEKNEKYYLFIPKGKTRQK